MKEVEDTTAKPTRRPFYRSIWLLFLVGLILGALIVLGIRLATYMPEHTHYHANFAVYLNGKRFEFKAPQYYQEVAICSTSHGVTVPQQRAHMHDNVNSVVHVHDHATTWGQFFENLGWYVGPDFIQTDDGTRYLANDDQKVHIMIDGEDYTDLSPISNTVIKDQSKLLVSFGSIDDTTLQQEYKTVAATAKHYDETTDPLSCSGAENMPLKQRLHHLF